MKAMKVPTIRAARSRVVRVSAAGQMPGATPFAAVKSEAEFFGLMKAGVQAGKIPEKLMLGWQQFYDSYKGAILGSGVPGHDEKFVAEVMGMIADRVMVQFKDPYTFPSFHERIKEPYDYFQFGQKYVGSLLNYSKSFVGHAERFREIDELLKKGENVIIMANHQTEADPGVFALLTEGVAPKASEEVIYIAGDRVVTDAMCKPFSMGRNLLCVHSKKHMDDYPELKAAKMAMNRKTLVTMQRLLNEGGRLIWVAPSGGRDRASTPDCEFFPDSFDPAAVGLFLKMSTSAKKPTHIFPMAMWTYAMMPPPKVVEKAVGEKRINNYTGTGISIGAELDAAGIAAGIADPEAQVEALAKEAHRRVCEEYVLLNDAITKGKVSPHLSQPFPQLAAKV